MIRLAISISIVVGGYWAYNHRDEINPEELAVTVGEFVGKSAHVMYKLAKSIDKSFSDADASTNADSGGAK
jgi:hypothetical protein